MDNRIYISSINHPKHKAYNKGRQRYAAPSLDEYDGYNDEYESYQDYDVYAGNTRRSFALNRLSYE